MKMEKYIKQTLIAPSDIILILFVNRVHFVYEINFSHSAQIHKHNARVKTELAVVGMTRESIVPALEGLFVLRRKCRYLRRVELLKMTPNICQVRDE